MTLVSLVGNGTIGDVPSLMTNYDGNVLSTTDLMCELSRFGNALA